jgi:hypothetical protein
MFAYLLISDSNNNAPDSTQPSLANELHSHDEHNSQEHSKKPAVVEGIAVPCFIKHIVSSFNKI